MNIIVLLLVIVGASLAQGVKETKRENRQAYNYSKRGRDNRDNGRQIEHDHEPKTEGYAVHEGTPSSYSDEKRGPIGDINQPKPYQNEFPSSYPTYNHDGHRHEGENNVVRPETQRDDRAYERPRYDEGPRELAVQTPVYQEHNIPKIQPRENEYQHQTKPQTEYVPEGRSNGGFAFDTQTPPISSQHFVQNSQSNSQYPLVQQSVEHAAPASNEYTSPRSYSDGGYYQSNEFSGNNLPVPSTGYGYRPNYEGEQLGNFVPKYSRVYTQSPLMFSGELGYAKAPSQEKGLNPSEYTFGGYAPSTGQQSVSSLAPYGYGVPASQYGPAVFTSHVSPYADGSSRSGGHAESTGQRTLSPLSPYGYGIPTTQYGTPSFNNPASHFVDGSSRSSQSSGLGLSPQALGYGGPYQQGRLSYSSLFPNYGHLGGDMPLYSSNYEIQNPTQFGYSSSSHGLGGDNRAQNNLPGYNALTLRGNSQLTNYGRFEEKNSPMKLTDHSSHSPLASPLTSTYSNILTDDGSSQQSTVMSHEISHESQRSPFVYSLRTSPNHHEDIELVKHYEVPVVKEVHVPHHVPVPIPQPVPVKIPQPYAVRIPVPVPIQRTIQVPYERPVHYPVEKPYPVEVVKKVPSPVAQPYPVPVPVYKTKYVVHKRM